MELIEREGFWWPADDGWCHKVIHQEVGDLDIAVRLAKGRSVAVQAGGNVGVWASWLARQFKSVVTVEPDATNYACLQKNVPANVQHRMAGFGEAAGKIGLIEVKGNAGAHYAKADGDIELITIDSLNLEQCDLICLDVEGSEPMALKGAEHTIKRFKPVVMIEEKGLSERYYNIKRGTAETWLKSLGYALKAGVRADLIFAQ